MMLSWLTDILGTFAIGWTGAEGVAFAEEMLGLLLRFRALAGSGGEVADTGAVGFGLAESMMGCCHMRRCSHSASGDAQRQRRRVGGGWDSSRSEDDVRRGEEREEGCDEGSETGREGEGERREERGRHLRRYWLAAGGALDRAGHFARTPPVVARQPTHARGEPRASGRRRRSSSRNRPRSGGRARGTTRQAGQQRAAGGEGQPEQSSRRDVGVGELAAVLCVWAGATRADWLAQRGIGCRPRRRHAGPEEQRPLLGRASGEARGLGAASGCVVAGAESLSVSCESRAPDITCRLSNSPSLQPQQASSQHRPRHTARETLLNTRAMSERGNFRGGGRGGGRGRGGGDRGGRGGGAGGAGNKEGGERKKENILDLNKYMDKAMTVKFNGGREGE